MSSFPLHTILALFLLACSESTSTTAPGSTGGAGSPGGAGGTGGAGGAGAPTTCLTRITCKDRNADCGSIDDGCEGTLECGTCTAPETCGADNRCGCIPETDPAFCARLGKDCDEVSNVDNCEKPRTANCGTCSGQETCGGTGVDNVCGQNNPCAGVTCP
ncbi:MAG: hypothetical protein MUF64_22375, partial [Polyangiaceae bacterium]|nr:hypothetical protein [Polyangiaceae bacterium]